MSEPVQEFVQTTEPEPAVEVKVEQPTPQPTEPVPTMTKDNNLTTQLDTYHNGMLRLAKVTGNPSATLEVAKLQRGFYKLLRGILNQTNQAVVNTQWAAVLAYAKAHKDTIFNETQLFRGAEAWAGSASDFAQYRRLAWVILQTMEPATRKANLKTLNLDIVLQHLNATEKASFINFYE